MSSAARHPKLTRRSLHRQRGAVAIVVGLALAVMIGFVGLALDLGKLYVTRSELQNSADACALSAARDLTSAISLSVAEADGIAAGHVNFAFFQKSAVQMLTDSNVTFSDALTNPFLTKTAVSTPANVKYVKCTATLSGIANWFVGVLNAMPGVQVANATQVSASAIATVAAGQTTCAIPVFVCRASSAAPYKVGDWISSPSGSSSTYGPGNFGWAALDGSTNETTIASELAGNTCNITSPPDLGSTGLKSASLRAWNTRFGIYTNGANGSSGQPDFTGYAYVGPNYGPPGTPGIVGDAYTQFVLDRASFKSYQGDGTPPGGSGIATNGTATAGNYQTYGGDRRLALAPEGDCSTLSGSSSKLHVTQWDCVLMLDPLPFSPGAGGVVAHLEYLGSTASGTTPCATHGLPGVGSSAGVKVPMLVQ
ncbi:TadE/TadG family type IV pilus assembly protein [Burkholderia vietnamiensis]|jgi:Flp pilus assembly protein TadG|uniref:TadE/TadG family type IV pilus assembly protein n=1 Tax=Burkholderia vietnamiensis TaxID=60552 RepID=UPI00075AC1FD|nr:TadE/TadG family type IV pilus assembly protein [Burkholderia vietnamiensis]KVE53394.1 pilus assembly protein TadG [Burkholderia vietnamiensis]KVE77915.1 pilus assembly protein TadG [Burkholderia vietnamiensis]KVE83221.1 pilus assembly protein TadG [Burkholderia vietnamiensis]MDN7928518.1 Tad domain-containing protein [Burkholderia vietnamiensis]CAG9201403.1 Pilus assembly protein TadG [Burkholderia vietnamiensis]